MLSETRQLRTQVRRSTPITLLNPDPILKNAISSIKRAQPRNSAVDPG
jgi:hypothetical protein